MVHSEERYELVGGVARPVARANQGRNVIRSNVLAALVIAGKRRGLSCHVGQHRRADRPGYDPISGCRGGLRTARCGGYDGVQT